MKKTVGLTVAALASLMLFTACSSQQAQSSKMDNMDNMNMDMSNSNVPVKPKIDFSTSPSTVQVNKQTELVERVTLQGKAVSDAKVEMEIWQDGSSAHQMLQATPGADGRYTVNETFAKPGLYHVQLHTTAGGLHQMPTMDVKVSQ